MSLKAKIEAVIYAAEEPVTLAQLAAIFASEVPATPAPEPTPAETAALDFEDQPDAQQPVALSGEPEPGHEITVIDASGLMQDAPVEEATAPLGIDADIEDSTSVASLSESELEEAAKLAGRKREREIRDHLRALVDELIADYATEGRGIEVREIAGGYRMATKPEFHDAVRSFVKSLKPPMKLTLQALETLAVIAYKQPVTAPEVAEIRGVDAGGVLAGLISRKLVTTAGRKQVIGRPILYKTTKEFLMRFGLKDVAELPSMEEFEKMAGELEESDALEASAMDARAGVPAMSEDDQLPFEQTDEGAPSPTQSGAMGDAESASALDNESSSQPEPTPSQLSSRPERSAAEGSAFDPSQESEQIPQEQER